MPGESYANREFGFGNIGDKKTMVKDNSPYNKSGWREETPSAQGNTDKFFCGEDLIQKK